jgi:hypothetical protein
VIFFLTTGCQFFRVIERISSGTVHKLVLSQ